MLKICKHVRVGNSTHLVVFSYLCMRLTVLEFFTCVSLFVVLLKSFDHQILVYLPSAVELTTVSQKFIYLNVKAL